MRRWKAIFGLGLASLLFMAACAPTSTSPREAAEGAGDARANLPGDFSIRLYQGSKSLGGQEVQFSELFQDGKPVVLNFWAGLCPPCRLEMPDFQEVYEARKGQLVLVGLDVGSFTQLGTPEDGRALVQELGVDYPVGNTADSSVMQEYSVLGMPTTVFLNPQGEVVKTWSGLLTKEKMEELVDELMAASSG
jgi:thiol-disulfide isomerase/thioredoxin